MPDPYRWHSTPGRPAQLVPDYAASRAWAAATEARERAAATRPTLMQRLATALRLPAERPRP